MGAPTREITRDIGHPSATALGSRYLLSAEKRPEVHGYKRTQKLRSTYGVQVLRWSSHSTDLNPIENLREHLKRRLRAQPSRPSRGRSVYFSETYCETAHCPTLLVFKQPRCPGEVLKNKGGETFVQIVRGTHC